MIKINENLKKHIRHVIFEWDTPDARLFDVILIVIILASVAVVLLASVPEYQHRWGLGFRVAEWTFTVLFTVEYVARLWSVNHRRRYALSFFGVVDFVSILPTYLSLFLPGAEYLIVVRTLRVLRVFRVLKLLEYVRGANVILSALWASRQKIAVFIMAVLVLVTILGSAMYLVESPDNGFSSIPISIYWAVVTLTTVGYGDISPGTPLGKALAAVVMLLGYSIIAVPTGIVTAEIVRGVRESSEPPDHVCPRCGVGDHAGDARYCRLCGECLLRDDAPSKSS